MNSSRDVTIEMVNEPAFSFGSADNSRRYPVEILLDEKYRPSSIHGIIVDGTPLMVVGASGGATGIHAHSVLRLDEIVYFAVGPYVCRFTIGNAKLDWHLQTDEATCFGIHYSKRHDALISHGELEISRFDAGGHILWSAGGADIFSGEISLSNESIRAVDFEGRVYHFDYTSGHEKHLSSN